MARRSSPSPPISARARNWSPAREKALLLGVKPENIFIEDLREEFVRDYVFPMFRANAQYEGLYLLGTSIARPLIAKKQIEIARQHGRRRRLPWRDRQGQRSGALRTRLLRAGAGHHGDRPLARMGFRSRAPTLIAFAEEHQIPIAKDKRGEAPFSTDANLLHTSSEGKVLEDPAQETPDYVYSRTVNPEDAPDAPQYITIDFEKGDARRGRRRGAVAGGAARQAERARARCMASAVSISSRTASSA